jgi:hypothetical protein
MTEDRDNPGQPDPDHTALLAELQGHLDDLDPDDAAHLAAIREYVNADSLLIHGRARGVEFVKRGRGFSARQRAEVERLMAALYMEAFVMGARWAERHAPGEIVDHPDA